MSFFAADPAAWSDARLWLAAQREAGTMPRWPEWAILTDLRWHADRAMDRRGGKFAISFPTSDELSRTWGEPKSTVYRRLRAWRTWCDEGRIDEFAPIADARWNGGGTVAARSRNGDGTADNARTATIDETRNGGGTVMARPRNESGPAGALVLTDTDTEHREDPPSPPPVVVDAPAKPTRPRKQRPDPLAPTDDEAADWEDALGAVAEIDAALARRIDTRASKASDGTRAAILRAMRRDTADVLIRRLRHVARTSESLAFVRSGPGVDALLVDPTKANRDGKPAWTSRLDNEAARIADTAAGSRTLAEPTPGNWRDPAWLPAVRVTTAPARGSPGPQAPPPRVPLGERMRLARLAAEAANHQPGADDAPLLLPAAR